MTVESLMTTEEVEAFHAVSRAALLTLKLPRQHPSENGELIAAFHNIQRALLARPTHRYYREELDLVWWST